LQARLQTVLQRNRLFRRREILEFPRIVGIYIRA
jgi:hypothetical protein